MSAETQIIYDTVRTVLDSSFSVQVLRDSQSFYRDSFSDLLVVFSVLMALFVAALTIAWNKKFDVEKEKLRNEMKESIKYASEEYIKYSKKSFEDGLNELRKETDEAYDRMNSVWPMVVRSFIIQASTTRDSNDCLRICILAFDTINKNFCQSLILEADVIITILEKRFVGTIHTDLKRFLCKTLVGNIEEFECFYFQFFVDKSMEEKQRAMGLINRIKPVIKSLSQYFED